MKEEMVIYNALHKSMIRFGKEKSRSNHTFKAFEYTGLGRGGQQIQKTKEVYAKAVETLVELASLQASPKKPTYSLWQYLY